MKTVAILGPTASGKTELSIALASRHDGVVLSLDSLSVYRGIDIASAKPTPEERGDIVHFGIDEVDVDTPFNISLYFELFRRAASYAAEREKPLIIVGGTGFYLKMLTEGLSHLPPLPPQGRERLRSAMTNLRQAYETLSKIDRRYAESISPKDRYRIEKGLQIFFASGTPPTEYYAKNPPKPLLEDVALFEIAADRSLLRERIAKRTKKMFEAGLVDEVAELEFRYNRAPNPMKSIGIREILDYFDAKCSLEEARERIITHTAQLAKRQMTFNRTQFPPHPLLEPAKIEAEVSSLLKR